MAKTTKKAFAGMTSKAPAKKPYAKSHEEFIGSPSMQSGKTAKAKADYKKAVKGGAAKTAKKLVEFLFQGRQQTSAAHLTRKKQATKGTKGLKSSK